MLSLRKPNISDIYILIWILYSMQGGVLKLPSIVSQLLLMVVFLMSAYFFAKVNLLKNKPQFFSILNLFIAIMTIYGLVMYLDSTPIYYGFSQDRPATKLEYFKAIYISLLPIYAAYFFGLKGFINDKSLFNLLLVLLSVIILKYFAVEYLNVIDKNFSSENRITNNVSYTFVHLCPLLFLIRGKFIQKYVFALTILAFTVLSMKRGAMLIAGICFMWFCYSNYKSVTKKQRQIISILNIIVLLIGTYYIIDFYNNDVFFQKRIEQTLNGYSSGRDNLYGTLWDHFCNQDNILTILFGNGAFQTINIVGNFAHNDWLELLTCQGLLGALMYILFFVSLYGIYKHTKNFYLCHNTIGVILIIAFLSSLFSMFYNSMSLSMSLSLGYCLWLYQRKRNIY